MEPLIGVLALCASMVAVLVWIIKSQQMIIHNGLKHVQNAILKLPCHESADCPEDHDGD